MFSIGPINYGPPVIRGVGESIASLPFFRIAASSTTLLLVVWDFTLSSSFDHLVVCICDYSGWANVT